METYQDIAEEVIREYGYDKVIPTFLDDAKVTNGGLSRYQSKELAVKEYLCSQGYYEIQTIAMTAETDFEVDLNGVDSGANVISRSVAKDESKQVFLSKINGNNRCSGHTECDAIIMDKAVVSAIPEITASHIDASLIHEAAIGKIAGEQLIKLMTLGLTEAEAEAQIVNGFLK